VTERFPAKKLEATNIGRPSTKEVLKLEVSKRALAVMRVSFRLTRVGCRTNSPVDTTVMTVINCDPRAVMNTGQSLARADVQRAVNGFGET
jgi:hypothetical protein